MLVALFVLLLASWVHVDGNVDAGLARVRVRWAALTLTVLLGLLIAQRTVVPALTPRNGGPASPAGAAAVQQRAAAAIELLREHPDPGHSIPAFPDLPHRELQVSPYRFFYRVIDDTVWIVVLWHARQLPKRVDDAARGT